MWSCLCRQGCGGARLEVSFFFPTARTEAREAEASAAATNMPIWDDTGERVGRRSSSSLITFLPFQGCYYHTVLCIVVAILLGALSSAL